MLNNLKSEVEGIRLDHFLAQELDGLSRSQVKRLIEAGQLWVNRQTVKAGYLLRLGDLISWEQEPEPNSLPEAEHFDLDLVYEDPYILVVNKPQGMVVHPAPGHARGTLVNALMAHAQTLSDLGGSYRPGIVHRIDKDTSGLILIVKDNQTHRLMAEQIKAHQVRRVYHTLVYGHPESPQGLIDAPIARDPHNRQKMAVVSGGKEARSHFEVLEFLPRSAYLRVELETGRTHQIRVHMNYIQHPVIGDPLYARGKLSYGLQGQALHAAELKFRHPYSGEEVALSCPLPSWFSDCLSRLRHE